MQICKYSRTFITEGKGEERNWEFSGEEAKKKGSDSREKRRESFFVFFLELETGKEKLGRGSNGKRREKIEIRSRRKGEWRN